MKEQVNRCTKTRSILLIIASLIGGGIQLQSSETLPERTWYVDMYDYSAGATMTKGAELLKSGDSEKARRYCDAAIARAPKEWPPYFARAFVFGRQQKWALAAEDLNTVLRLKPTLYLAAIVRGWMNDRLGNFRSSLADYEKILSFQPLPFTCASALNSRAWLRATCPDAGFRHAQQAIADANAACKLTYWSKPDPIDTLDAVS